MSDVDAADLVLLVLRCWIGFVMIAHGWNHVFGGGRIAGTAKWFASMGMRPPAVQAWMASLVELGGGALLVLGLLTPLASASVIGIMTVAWAINHRGNGFFIFRKGEGWEYVATLAVAALVPAVLGPGRWSLDRALDIDDTLTGTTGLLLAVLPGLGGAAALLAVSWRPSRPQT